MNNKGQALVEFILILPLFLFILFAVIDFGSIYTEKNRLENLSSDIVNLIKEGSNLENLLTDFEKTEKVDINMTFDNNYQTIIITSSVDLITPGLNLVMESPFPVEVKRVLRND